MKISIITVSYNSAKTIKRTIESVLSQKNVEIEFIIVDGQSKDGTVEIIKEFANRYSCIRWVSEKDSGIYDAMNKGINMATGNIIGILNSDDVYASDDILETVCKKLSEDNLDSCFGNLLYIKTYFATGSFIPYRYWRSGKLRSFKRGWMPPHPTFFVKKEVYDKYGCFRLDCGTSADYELMLRFLEKNKISSVWINKIFTYMEAGGASNATLKTYIKSHSEDRNAWIKNNLKVPFLIVWLKKIRKIPQFILAKFIKIDALKIL